MKKLHLLTAITALVFIITATSCRKSSTQQLSNWTCHCSMTNSSGTYSVNYAEQGLTQGAANDSCSKWQEANTSATTVAGCQLQQQ